MKARLKAGDEIIYEGPVDKVMSEGNAGLLTVGFSLKQALDEIIIEGGVLSLTFYKDDNTVIRDFPAVTLRHHISFATEPSPFNPYKEEFSFTVPIPQQT